MPFEKVDPQADFPALERKMLALWDQIQAFEKLKAKNAGKPRWSFLDGPITANNPMGVHHAWGRTYKDAYNRYFAMTGHELRFQQGFDCQGLWVEVEVEKDLKLHNKRDIENLVPGDVNASVARFVQECKNRVNRFARVQTEQSIRLGFWMNWDRTDADWAKSPDERKSYFTMSEQNNYTIWSFLKKCHHRGLIYRGYDSMPWCGRCGVGISEMEMKEGYKLVEHRSVFVKLPLKARPGENLLVWTTTPWTLTSNVGAAINPELTYLKVKLKGEIYYVGKGVFKQNRMESIAEEPEAQARGKRRDWLDNVPHLVTIEQMFKSKAGKEGYEIADEVKGADMLGWEYTGPFDDLPAQQHKYGFPEEVAKVVQQAGWAPAKSAAESHRVISGGADVTETEGTGIVHTAPGCGSIDFHWGKENGLPPIAPIDDSGDFQPGFGDLTGKNAADPATTDAIFEHLKRKDVLFATERYVHRYPHCWRCKTELLYRLVDEWFINMKWRDEIMEVVKKVTFLPESLNGQARELDWLKNMGDWMISKKRYWGLALPIWVDDKDPTQFEVVGSRDELKKRAVEGWEEFDGHTPHRPWVDKVKIRNPKTGNLMSRIPDVGNPWLDAGIVAFSTMPADWYPADFITESFPGQFRNWFYSLLAMSTMMSDGKPPFKNLLGFATVMDQFGKPMHKSDGNAIEFNRAAGEEGDEGYELFHDIEPKQDAKVALAKLPKNHLGVREELIELKGQQFKRVYARYKPIGADVMRWLYCRQNPASNLLFGPEPADEVRGRFIIKLWNCYSFFVNYARLDGFDPTLEQGKNHQDIDRWILSDLQGLITTARQAFESYNVMAFCIEAERFVDDRLSNWYIRRNRPRFQSNVSELDDAGLHDKWAAHHTLYRVMTTLCKLFAPVIPFLSEAMWQNLRTANDPESVHLCDYPQADPAIEDEELSKDMEFVREVVNLGLSARKDSKIKTRQPLNMAYLFSFNSRAFNAVVKFQRVIGEELNIKGIGGQFLPPDPNYAKFAGAKYALILDKKRAGARLGKDLQAVTEALKKIDLNNTRFLELLKKPIQLEISGRTIEVLSDEVSWELIAPPGEKWVLAYSPEVQLILDSRVDEKLELEGLARDVIRQVQEHRKNSGLEMQDRIALYLGTESAKLRSAIDAHREHIAAETLTVSWSDSPFDETTEVKIEAQAMKVSLRKI